MSVITKKISVIIPVKNEEKRIERCLESVFNQSYRSMEVIVVDGHSTDKTIEIARKFPVKIFFENYGTRGGARQVGLEKAMGQYVAFTDADCMPEKGWLENLVKESDSNIVGVGGAIRNSSTGIWGKSISFAMNTFLGSANSVQGRLFKSKRFVGSISGCNSMYRKEDLMKVGGFDIGLSINEDTRLNRKLLKNMNGKLLYTPDAVVIHNHGRDIVSFARQMHEYGYGRGRNRLWDLQVVPPLLIPLLFISVILTPWIFLVALGIYLTALMAMGFEFGSQEKSVKCFLSLLFVYIIEHSLYAVGFWHGIFKGMLPIKFK